MSPDSPGPSLRRPPAVETEGLRGHGDPHPGRLHRRQRDHLQRRQRGAAAGASVPGGRIGSSRIMNSYPGAGVERASNGVPDYFDRRRETDVFEEQALYRAAGTDDRYRRGQPERSRRSRPRPTIFRVLKAEPLRGRLLNDSDGEDGQERKVVLSYTLWQRCSAAATMRSGRTCGSTACRTSSSACCRETSCS